MRATKKVAGFTLVELSIVLVIIGLLIGGILVAQSMIGTTKIQAQIRQLQQFDIAVTNFKTKFNQIPGDCSICDHPNIWQLWNGGGIANDGILEDSNGTSPPQFFYSEPAEFFPDLQRMGQLVANNSDISNDVQNGFYNIGAGEILPAAVIGRGGIIITGNAFGDLFYVFLFGNSLFSNDYDYSSRMAQGSFSPAEAAALDTKVDDGIPATGNVQSVGVGVNGSTSVIPFTSETDSASTCVYNAIYNTALPATNLCRLIIKANFQ